MKSTFRTGIAVALITVFSAGTALANDAVRTMTRFYEIADARPFDVRAFEKMYADDFVNHDPRPNVRGSFKQDSIALYTSLANGAPDAVHEITFIKPVGDNQALVRWKFKGTHTGPMLGIPATGKRFDIAGMELWEVKNGKVTSIWHVEEIAKLMRQLGLAK